MQTKNDVRYAQNTGYIALMLPILKAVSSNGSIGSKDQDAKDTITTGQNRTETAKRTPTARARLAQAWSQSSGHPAGRVFRCGT